MNKNIHIFKYLKCLKVNEELLSDHGASATFYWAKIIEILSF